MQSQLPVRTEFRLFHVVVGGYLAVDRLLADPEDLSNAAPERYRPLISALLFPVRRDDGCGCKVKTVSSRNVVVDEVLPGEQIDLFLVIVLLGPGVAKK